MMAKQILNIKDVSSHERKTAVPYRFRCDRKRKERKKNATDHHCSLVLFSIMLLCVVLIADHHLVIAEHVYVMCFA